MTLRPQRNFTIVRQLNNPFITATFYVQAVIRDSYTDTIIDTLNLTDKGGQRFTKNWQVPADPSGQGRDISIVTSVYTDSGYTTKSSDYGDEESSYLIEEKTALAFGHGGNTLDGFDIRRIFQEELQKRADEEDAEEDAEDADEPAEIEVEEPMRFDEVLAAIHSLKTALKPAKPEKVDLTPILKQINAVGKAIEAKEVTEPTDLTPVLSKLDDHGKEHELSVGELTRLLNILGAMITKEIPGALEKILQTATFKIAPSTATMDLAKKPAPQPQPTPFDISKLTS